MLLVQIKQVETAIRIVGGFNKAAEIIGCSVPVLYLWRKNRKMPDYAILKLEAATECLIKRHEMAPELFEGYELIKEN